LHIVYGLPRLKSLRMVLMCFRESYCNGTF
jgi:hypothetical protein